MREWPPLESGELFAPPAEGGSDGGGALLAVVLNYTLPPCLPAVWRRARLRVAADGGVNRLYDELPRLLPHLSALQARSCDCTCAALCVPRMPDTASAGARGVRAGRGEGRLGQRAAGGARLLRCARHGRHRRR
jgi:hypothetical protein